MLKRELTNRKIKKCIKKNWIKSWNQKKSIEINKRRMKVSGLMKK